ncbi:MULTISPECIES: head maturation protease, ClpP-related [Bacteroidales]|jgi:ATP-dependent Clp endopeptidase proteolytic subunit ClpP|uniref:head maturation protease, ClpP-related n=1 Tax=Bacteroidales TaxID=171549 RepID=UPI002586756F|nr:MULTISPECIES: head maturation protease, ClpP-related [Bacteroidales]
MNKYLNIHTAPDGIVTIFLYGEIGDYGDVKSGNVVSELKAAENSGARIDVRINSIGGDVYSGIALYNALKGSRADIHIYIDGVAASMAAVLALCGKPVTMSKYARLMLHSVSGGCYGNKTELRRCIDEIQALEDSLADMLASKLKTDKAQIKSSYFDDNDHWLTAGEALSLGLVDGIYDADPVPDDSTPEQIYSIFNNRLDKPSNDNQMNLEELKKHPRFKDCADDAAVLREIDSLEKAAGKVPGLENENRELKEKVKGFEDKAAEAEETERASLLDAAEQDGRINARTRPTFENILKRDMEEGKAALAALTPKRKVMEDINRPTDSDGPFARRMKEIKDRLKK